MVPFEKNRKEYIVQDQNTEKFFLTALQRIDRKHLLKPSIGRFAIMKLKNQKLITKNKCLNETTTKICSWKVILLGWKDLGKTGKT